MEKETRCPWCLSDPLLRDYHDRRWGRPEHGDRELFAQLVLECFSVGLSWRLILHKEEALRRACGGLDPEICALYGPEKEEELLRTPRIIHHRGKIRSIGENARAFLEVRKEWGSFDAYLWHWTEGKPVVRTPEMLDDIPAEDELSRKVSRDMKKRGFRYLGPVTVYSYMQGVGLINDHLLSCPYK